MNFQVIDPTTYKNWDELLLLNPGASFFHSTAWVRVLSESYSYKPVYFTVWDGDRLTALFPMMDVRSFLTGKRGVSLPFTDYCEPLLGDATAFQEMLDQVIGLHDARETDPVLRLSFPYVEQQLNPSAAKLWKMVRSYFRQQLHGFTGSLFEPKWHVASLSPSSCAARASSADSPG